MKKLLLIAFIALTFASCKKTSLDCWTCYCVATNGIPAHEETFCQDENPSTTGQMDRNGNQSISSCTR